jgi:glycosyltransferase involved in cell wall biosynthesis
VNSAGAIMPSESARASVMFLLDSAPQNLWTSVREAELCLCRALTARNILPILVLTGDYPDEIRDRYKSAGALVFSTGCVPNGNPLRYYREIGRLIGQFKPSLVHIDHFSYFSSVPWMARLHGVSHIVYMESNSGVLRARSWKNLLLQLRTRIMTWPVTRMIAVSEFIRRRLIEVGVPSEKIEVIYNGVDIQRFTPDPSARESWIKRFQLRSDELILSSVAFSHRFKHPEVIVEAISHLVKRGVAVQVFIAGRGEMQAESEVLARRLGIGPFIHWLGDFSSPETLLRASDIFILASVGEAFGYVLAEAMACGTPVVGSRSGAIGEVAEDGGTGLLATPLDAVSFADAIERLACDAQLRHDMGARGVDRVRKLFAAETMIEKVMRLYGSISADLA